MSDTPTTPPAEPTERVDPAQIRAKVNAARMAAILDEEEVVLVVTRDGIPGVLALIEQRETDAKRLGAAGVCGAIANLLRDSKPWGAEYEGIRAAYGVALDAAGLSERGEYTEEDL